MSSEKEDETFGNFAGVIDLDAVLDNLEDEEQSSHAHAPEELEEEKVKSKTAPQEESGRRLGLVCPEWIPDASAPNCAMCESRFTLVRRRHHCRVCGNVFCALCSSLKIHLPYMDNKLGRACDECVKIMTARYVRETLYRLIVPRIGSLFSS